MRIRIFMVSLTMAIVAKLSAGEFKHIVIDGLFDDWAGIAPAFEDPEDSTTSIDYAKVYIANDADYIYFRMTLHRPGSPFTSHENLFVDANNDSSGFPFHGIGSEMLIQSGTGYEERAGGFNDGFNIANLGWAAAPEGTGTDFEFRVSRSAAFTSTPPGPVFSADTFLFVLEAEAPNFSSAEFAPDEGGFAYTPAPTPTAAAGNTVLVSTTGSSWKVNSTGTDLGTAWREPGYDDSQVGWTTGQGLFGFTPNPAAYPAPIQTPLTGNGWYLRTRFEWTNDPASVILVASNYLSDGAVFYLNGAEVKRVRLPSGDLALATPATGAPAVKGQVELTGFPTSPLIVGENVLAVEVHQSSGDTADLVFGGSLTAARQFPAVFTDSAQPGDRAVGAGNATTFSAAFIGSAPLSYQWLKDGLPIAGATDATFTIDPVLQGDAGGYALRVSNSLATNTSRAAILTVTNSPARITDANEPANQTVTEGLPVTFAVHAVGSAPLSYQWFKGGTAIANATNETFTIADVRAADAGAYYVVVTNLFPSSVTSRTAQLTVTPDTARPVIDTINGTPNTITLIFSEPVTLSSATNLANYSIAGLPITQAVQDTSDASTVVLTTAAQTLGTSYALTVRNIVDRFNNTIAANTVQTFKSRIVIDGRFDDWAGVPLAFSDAEDSTESLDYKDVYVTHDEDFIYMRVSFWKPGEMADFHNNIFIDADNDPTTGYAFHTIGSDLLMQSGGGYEEAPGIFNNGTASGLDWLISPEGPATEVEFRISRAAIYDSDGARVFTTNMIAFVLEAENAGFATKDFAPDDGGFTYSLISDAGALAITRNAQGQAVISWESTTARLQTRASLSTGSWADVPNAVSPFPVTPSAPQAYFRLIQ